ncbi:transcription termination factor Rho domain protein [Mycobacterium xenopi 4042]|uniref:Transcription termination factor Rho domain protein n=1 Tax=Mycobacterium xenopi 4042 TaxID=1299334 RepID=X8E0Y8_MYCXE|nr:transcription termination factor Rho domain protein [Mycobacterium xenopi 4042]
MEAITSPLTERCISVTSSGRSSTRTTIKWHSGLFLVIALAMSLRIVVLPAFGARRSARADPYRSA